MELPIPVLEPELQAHHKIIGLAQLEIQEVQELVHQKLYYQFTLLTEKLSLILDPYKKAGLLLQQTEFK